jgi:hypothetical protein
MLDLASQSFRYAGSAILRATSLVSEDATNREVKAFQNIKNKSKHLLSLRELTLKF